jgi:hypothetical protein
MCLTDKLTLQIDVHVWYILTHCNRDVALGYSSYISIADHILNDFISNIVTVSVFLNTKACDFVSYMISVPSMIFCD